MEEDRLKHFSHKLDFDYLLSKRFPVMALGPGVHGQGVITQEDIAKGQAVCPLFGVLYNVRKAKIDYPKYSYQISDDVAIETVNEPGFFNHSCDPNTYINSDWMFEAIRDIKDGEEVLVDYGTVDYFDYSFECSCGSETCRKDFNGEISADPNYQKRMGKYFSPYLKERFHP